MKTGFDLESIRANIHQYLGTLGVSKKTIRNYRSDANHFFLWLSLRESSGAETNFGNDLFSEYLTYMHQTKTPEKTIERRLTTVKHISKSLSYQNILSKNYKFHPQRLNVKILSHPNLGKMISVAAVSSFFLITGFTLVTIYQAKKEAQGLLLLPKNTTALLNKNTLGSSTTSDYDWAQGTIQLVLRPSDFPVTPKNIETASIDYQKTTPTLPEQKLAILEAGGNGTTVNDDNITPYSTVLITPRTDTKNQVLYIKDQGDGYFTVAINNALDADVYFYWNAQ
jgi:hypothetical protein